MMETSIGTATGSRPPPPSRAALRLWLATLDGIAGDVTHRPLVPVDGGLAVRPSRLDDDLLALPGRKARERPSPAARGDTWRPRLTTSTCPWIAGHPLRDLDVLGVPLAHDQEHRHPQPAQPPQSDG
jgi:hypothetical protein